MQVVDVTSGWALQLGSKETVRERLQVFVEEWDDAFLEQYRLKDARWAWVYSRYFYRGYCSQLCCFGNRKAQRLFIADMRETAMLSVMLQSLRPGAADGGSYFEALYEAYNRTNRQKYALMFGDPAGLAMVSADVIDDVPAKPAEKQEPNMGKNLPVEVDRLPAGANDPGGELASLPVLVRGAKGLADADFLGTSDAFCSIRLGPPHTAYDQKAEETERISTAVY